MHERARTYLHILHEISREPAVGAMVLDFGCGNGDLVAAFRSMGFQAFGCDLKFEEGEHLQQRRGAGLIRLITVDPYRLPFEDSSFDVVVSDEVFEHVTDYPTAISEIRRVLKPGGGSLHIFPSRYRFIEPHVYVPMGTVIQSRLWLRLWAHLGVRNEYQDGFSAKETARLNAEWLPKYTNYLKKQQIHRYFSAEFSFVRFCEAEFLRQSPRGRVFGQISRLFPFFAGMYGSFRCRVIYAA
jgi:ubiquinone/menaquinone biosynthesis C-methylase UbiE